MDFTLTEEQRLFQTAIKNFTQTEIAPLVKEAEQSETCPTNVFSMLGKLGYLCPSFPPEYGGGGLGKVGECVLIEELAKVCCGICAGVMVQSGLATLVILKHGSEEQRQKFLIPAAKGEKIAAFALTEPNAGSDAAAIETTARRDNHHYVVNGSKIYITNGQICDFITLAASVDRNKGRQGISVFIVERDTPGLNTAKMRKLGHHSAATAELAFDDCRVPAENLVGEEGAGFKYILESLTASRISHSARSVGLAEACLGAALKYAKERIQFGRPIGKFQAISFKIARMATEIEAARWLLYRAAWLYDQGEECRMEAPMTKLFSSEVAIRAAEETMRIYAGAGYLAESDVQRYFRDAILFCTTEGTNEIQQLIIARELGL